MKIRVGIIGATGYAGEELIEILLRHSEVEITVVTASADLEKEELILEPLIGTTRPEPENEAKILTQIERIADARAELEKGNSRMLLSILQVLTPDQWSKLPATGKKVFWYGPLNPKPAK